MSHLTRRTFLKSSAAACAAACLGNTAPAEGSVAIDPARQVSVLVDLTRCIGCRACGRACNERNNLPQDDAAHTAWEGKIDMLSFNRWTVVNLEGEGAAGEAKDALPVKRQCMHCLDPACVSVCPVGALHRLPSGAVVYREERCIGCRYCMFACPFKIPKFEWASSLTPVIGKCQFCAQHPIFKGPACAAACPTGALKFSNRKQLLFEARARIGSRPDRYVPHIYGEHEAGGTSWMYLAGRPFSQLGFEQNLPDRSLPSLTRMALGVIPVVVTVLGALLGFVAYIFRAEAKASHGEAENA